MSRLQQLHETYDQSPWLDNLRRGWLTGGELQRMIDGGILGITSNPTIFQKAIEGGDAYDAQFADLINEGSSVADAYWDLVIKDIQDALALLRPVYDASAGGGDGFVSIEVAPSLAHDTEGSISAARHLHQLIDQPNLYVKIPGTAEGVPAIRQMLTEGRNINITLLFGLSRYAEVIEAYISALEARVQSGEDVSQVHSVASFFVSRVDTEVDRRLEEIGTEAALALRGKAAVANAQAAYQLYAEQFSGPRWDALAAEGANVQRPLWASSSTKNEAYPDTLYVDSLIGPRTVNTLTEATIEAFEDHGTLARTVDADPEGAQSTLDALEEVGIDMADVARTLEDEGVASFGKSFDELLTSLGTKAGALQAGEG